ncbi:MAG: hypothetical protein ACLFM9_04470 [Candidatus Aenigmatarchaeota archaeon]
MLDFLDFDNFFWGLILSLFAVVIILGASFLYPSLLSYAPEAIPLYTLLGFSISLVLFESVLLIYMHSVNTGLFHSEERAKSMLLKLNSIQRAKENLEKEDEYGENMLEELEESEEEVKRELRSLMDAKDGTED